MQTAPYDALMAFVRETEALRQTAMLLSWDQETMMPPKGAALRAEQAAALSGTVHARAADPRIAAWLSDIDDQALDPPGRRNVALIRRDHDRAQRLPAGLAAALARAIAAGTAAWIDARRQDDMAPFAPALDAIVALKREEAAALARDGQGPYDALLDDFEPGMRADDLLPMLEALRHPLTELRGAIGDRPGPSLTGDFPSDGQRALARRLAQHFGYDLDAGRIDTAIHPFCSGQGGDVRITTRIDPANPLDCMLSTIHEVGHAVYIQNMAPGHLAEPVGQHASMGVHESQSRLFENQIGRSYAFARWLRPVLVEQFGDTSVPEAAALYAAMNRVETGFIRTEADEVHYNLHIILRSHLERDLIEGRLAVADLEAAWNDRFAADFGRQVPSPLNGVLQDIHWAKGLFGYFPTYALGNIYAAELFAALDADLGGVDAPVAAGDLAPIRDWLREKVHRPANLYPPADLIARAVGHAPTAAPLVDYLWRKFGLLYGLEDGAGLSAVPM